MSLGSLIATGTKVWLDGVEPADINASRALGVTGATSNPTIVSQIVGTGHFDDRIVELARQGHDDAAIAWALDDALVKSAEQVFLPVWQQTGGDDGYVSFELDPLIEDDAQALPHAERVRRYIELGKQWSAGHQNRMIKVPATPAGIDALEALTAAGVTINVTLMFTERQYCAARDAIWRGAHRRRDGIKDFKSVYSIFISRIDVYAQKHLRDLSPSAADQLGIATAKTVWRLNEEFWKDKPLRLRQEIVFASTGVKDPAAPADKYVEALAGSDIQTNPSATNKAIEHLNKTYDRKIDQMPAKSILTEIEQKVDLAELERVLMNEGNLKFAEAQKSLLRLIARKRGESVKRNSPQKRASQPLKAKPLRLIDPVEEASKESFPCSDPPGYGHA
jgi:transaldolase